MHHRFNDVHYYVQTSKLTKFGMETLNSSRKIVGQTNLARDAGNYYKNINWREKSPFQKNPFFLLQLIYSERRL
jgi:hypothetical protein